MKNNLDKYREEAEKVIQNITKKATGTAYSNEVIIAAMLQYAEQREKAARLLSEQAIRTAFKAGEEYGMDRFRCAFEMEYVTKPNEVKYLSTHTPPLINLEALIDGVYDDLVEPALSSANMKQQYITDKIKSL